MITEERKIELLNKEDMGVRSVLNMCELIDVPRNSSDVILKAMEELGELATEVAIKHGKSYKKPSDDGIVGEAVDLMICVLDILHLEGATSEDIRKITAKKVKKWYSKTMGV